MSKIYPAFVGCTACGWSTKTRAYEAADGMKIRKPKEHCECAEPELFIRVQHDGEPVAAHKGIQIHVKR